jgi:predicted AAA+ superfamily ATPase
MDTSKLEQVIQDQRLLKFEDGFLKRTPDFHSSNEILVISGIRRCGKSTLMQEIRTNNEESDYYLNFDDERLVSFSLDDFQKLYELFIELYGEQRTFYFDEIQNIKGWERFVRRLYDYGNKIYITGSNASMLSRELGTHLTGRYIQYELFPFSFKEFLHFNNIDFNPGKIKSTNGKSTTKSMFNKYFHVGGFPAFLKSGNTQYLESLYQSIIYRDVMVRNGIANEREILELVHYLASNVARLITYNSLTKVIGVKNPSTVKNYLSYLQNTYMIFLLSKHDYSLKKQLQNPKKVYFIDNALVRQLGFFNSEDNGRLLENIVFIELMRRKKDVYYHKNKKECDFVIKDKNKITEAIQVSWDISESKTLEREISGLVEAMRDYSLNEGLILTNSEEKRIIKDDKIINVKPVWKWLLE